MTRTSARRTLSHQRWAGLGAALLYDCFFSFFLHCTAWFWEFRRYSVTCLFSSCLLL